MELSDFHHPNTAPRMKVDVILDQMDDDLRGIVTKALQGPTSQFPSRTIATVLTRNGWPISDSAVSNWRQKNVDQDG